MKEEIFSEKELKALEEEIRAMGIPYSENEPDERYFTNFRVRLMERIEEKQKKQNVFAAVWSWLSSSPLRSLSLGAGLAAIVAAAFFMQPQAQAPVATVQNAHTQAVEPKVESPSVIAPQAVHEEIAEAPKVLKAVRKPAQKANIAKAEKPNAVTDAANKAGNFALVDATLSSAESDDPVNLENLSESELESVIAITQKMK